MQQYPWYDIAEKSDELEQGDCIDDCRVLIPTYVSLETEEVIITGHQTFLTKNVEEVRDVIVITQSCDLENRKVDFIQLCPRMSFSEYVEIARNAGQNTKAIINNLNEIRLGRKYRYYMLQQCNLPNFNREIQIVDLGTSFSVPCDPMKQMVKTSSSRIRLLSPYKEQLAQAFAYFYMRVALPDPINEFKTLPVSMQVTTIPHQ